MSFVLTDYTPSGSNNSYFLTINENKCDFLNTTSGLEYCEHHEFIKYTQLDYLLQNGSSNAIMLAYHFANVTRTIFIVDLLQ